MRVEIKLQLAAALLSAVVFGLMAFFARRREQRQETARGGSWVFRQERGVGLRPWSHLLTNGRMGWLATDAGTGNLFLDNAREGQITPWENDPLTLWGAERLELRQGGETRSLFGDADGCPTEVTYGFGWAAWKRRLGRTETELTAGGIPEDADGQVALGFVVGIVGAQRDGVPFHR